MDSDRIQILIKENETLKCELYHMKKLQEELSYEKSSTCFISKIETLRSNNHLINSNLKQAKDQITILETQVCIPYFFS